MSCLCFKEFDNILLKRNPILSFSCLPNESLYDFVPISRIAIHVPAKYNFAFMLSAHTQHGTSDNRRRKIVNFPTSCNVYQTYTLDNREWGTIFKILDKVTMFTRKFSISKIKVESSYSTPAKLLNINKLQIFSCIVTRKNRRKYTLLSYITYFFFIIDFNLSP